MKARFIDHEAQLLHEAADTTLRLSLTAMPKKDRRALKKLDRAILCLEAQDRPIVKDGVGAVYRYCTPNRSLSVRSSRSASMIPFHFRSSS